MSEWSDSSNRAPLVIAASLLALIVGVGIVGARGGDDNAAPVSGAISPVASGSIVPESSIPIVSEPESTAQLTIPVLRVRPDDYLLRVQVDGADSLVTLGALPATPGIQQYVEPRITIP